MFKVYFFILRIFSFDTLIKSGLDTSLVNINNQNALHCISRNQLKVPNSAGLARVVLKAVSPNQAHNLIVADDLFGLSPLDNTKSFGEMKMRSVFMEFLKQ